MNKKIILSLLLVLIVAVSMSAVAAADGDDTEGDDAAVTITDDAKDIQTKIDNAKAGDTIELENKTYAVESTTFTLDKQVTVKGNGATITASGAAQGGSGALFVATAAGTGFEGITFVNTDGHKAYGEQVSGYAVQLAIENGTVDNCAFIDWGSGVYGRGAAFCTISNSYFNGSSEQVTNGGSKEYGTKAINLMGSHDITVTGCTFEGQVLDGISIASNSGNNIMTDNTFIENCYAIYFGGASTQGCVIANNTFIRCGWCQDKDGKVIFKNLPVISTQKAANGYIIADNTIEATEGSIFMKAESGNTAHGYPSKIGDINITGNTINAADGASPESITFMYILSNSGPLNPYAPIAITGNTIDAGITPVTVWYADWNAEDGVVIPAAEKAKTVINTVEVASADGTVTVALLDVNGVAQAGKAISYSINGAEAVNATTDENGQAVIEVPAGENATDATIAISFEGDDNLDASSAVVSFKSTATEKITTKMDAKNMNIVTLAPKIDTSDVYFNVTLVDDEGNALVNKSIELGVNGVKYTKTTDENGVARQKISFGYKGKYTFGVAFLGDDTYKSTFEVYLIDVAAQTPKLTTKDASYKAAAKTKSISATFKTVKGTAIANKKITFTVNGKTYTGTTNAKGVATVKVSLSKKGTYKFTAKYAGDDTYKAVSKTGKLTIK